MIIIMIIKAWIKRHSAIISILLAAIYFSSAKNNLCLNKKFPLWVES